MFLSSMRQSHPRPELVYVYSISFQVIRLLCKDNLKLKVITVPTTRSWWIDSHDDMVSVPSGIGNFEDQIVSARLPVATSRSRSVDCQPSEHHLLQLERVELERLEPATRPANKQLQIFRRWEPWNLYGQWHAFCLRHFFINGYKTLIMDNWNIPGIFKISFYQLFRVLCTKHWRLKLKSRRRRFKLRIWKHMTGGRGAVGVRLRC